MIASAAQWQRVLADDLILAVSVAETGRLFERMAWSDCPEYLLAWRSTTAATQRRVERGAIDGCPLNSDSALLPTILPLPRFPVGATANNRCRMTRPTGCGAAGQKTSAKTPRP